MTEELALRPVLPGDLPVFFDHQLDPAACYQAAFTVEDPADREAFDARWERILSNEQIIVRTILAGGQVAGYLVLFELYGLPEVGYWLGREFWGRGIATRALQEFLRLVPDRPLYAHAARDNLASVRVLEKCGFQVQGYGRYHSHARGCEVEEVLLELAANESV